MATVDELPDLGAGLLCSDWITVMIKNLLVSITYSRHEKRWIVATSGTKRDNMNMNYECKSREAALTLIADLFEMNI